MVGNGYVLQWTHFTHQVTPSHLRAPAARHSGLTPQLNSLLKTLPESLQMMDCPLPPELGARSPGTRDQLSGKCIFSMEASSTPCTGGFHCHAGRCTAAVVNPRFRVSARDPHLHHPTQLGEREDAVPLPAVWTPPASGHAEQLYLTCWHLSPRHQLQPVTNDSRSLS